LHIITTNLEEQNIELQNPVTNIEQVSKAKRQSITKKLNKKTKRTSQHSVNSKEADSMLYQYIPEKNFTVI
jgi:DNA topoisomerase VI subunit A